MHHTGSRPSAAPASSASGVLAVGPTVPWSALCGFVVAMVCFGAARIHASGGIALATNGNKGRVVTRIVDFHPNVYAPAAYADWSEASATSH